MLDAPSFTQQQPVAPAWHTWLYLSYKVLSIGLFYRSSTFSQTARPHSQIPFFSVLILADFLLLAYIAWGVHKRQGSLLGLVGGHWTGVRDFLRDCKYAFIFWIAMFFVFAGFRALLHPPPAKVSLTLLIPHNRIDLGLWFLVAITAGVTEEIIYRGYLQKQFSAWMNNTSAAMILSAVLFGFGHIYQGWQRAIMLGVYGWLLGWLAQQRKSLRPGILAHSWQDAIAGFLLFIGQRH